MTYTIANNSPAAGSISWTGVKITFAGTTYAVANGNTALKYVWWAKATPTTFQISATMPTLGADDAIVFVNNGGVATSILDSVVTDGGMIVPGTVTANAIAVATITGDKIAANTITATNIAAGTLTADKIASNTITGDKIAANTITASQIDSRGLSIKDVSGNIILAAGTGLNLSALANAQDVANSYTNIGQNLIPNSDQAQACSWAIHNNPNGAIFSTDQPRLSTDFWTKASRTYALAASALNSVAIVQMNVAAGTVDGSGDTATACDIIPTVGASYLDIPVNVGQRVCFSAYVQSHRCNAFLMLQFYDSAGVTLGGSGWFRSPSSDSLVGGYTYDLSQFVRLFVFGVVPAGASTVRVLVRKLNTLSGNATSHMWVAAPQFEVVNANTQNPSPYTPGPTSAIAQLGYTGDLNATSGARVGVNLTDTNGTTVSGVVSDQTPITTANQGVFVSSLAIGNGTTSNITINTAQLRLDANGNARFSGDITGASGTFSGSLQAGTVDVSKLVGQTTNYTSPGAYTLTVPFNGMNSMRVTLVGGGGGGGGGDFGGGGGGAETTVIALNGLTPGATYTLVVGAGGAAGAAGGTTYVSGVGSANGGGAGPANVDFYRSDSAARNAENATYPGGSSGGNGGQVGGNASLHYKQENQYYGDPKYASYYGGVGGNSLYGAGGAGAAPGSAARAGGGYGAGGGGAGGGGGTTYGSRDPVYPAQPGSNGMAIVEFFNPNGVVIRSEWTTLISALQRQGIATT